jgi:hypothetical protein
VNRSALRTILIAVLALSVLAFAASTLDTVQSGSPGFGGGSGGGLDGGPGGSGGGDTDQRGGDQEERDQDPGAAFELPEFCFPWLLEAPFLFFATVGLMAVFLVVQHYRDKLAGVMMTALLLVPGIPLLLFLGWCGEVENQQGGGGPIDFGNLTGGSSGGGGGFGGNADAITQPDLPVVLFVVLGAVAAIVVVGYAMTGDDDATAADDDAAGDEEADELAPERTDVGEVGRIAGEAADRIEDTATDAFENEVYRAWAEMTRPLEVAHPGSSTPREFADAAAAAGMAREDVDRLTDLFDEVRYGGEPATEEREAEAVAILRRIEDAYASGGADA